MGRKKRFDWNGFGLKEFGDLFAIWEGIVWREDLQTLCERESQVSGAAFIKWMIRKMSADCRKISRSKLSVNIVDNLIQDPRLHIRAALSRNEGCNRFHILKLLNDSNDRVSAFVACGPTIGKLDRVNANETLPEDWETLEALAKNPATSADVLRAIACHQRSYMALDELAENPLLPKDLFENLSFRDELNVQVGLCKNKKFPSFLLPRLANSKHYETREAVALREDLDLNTLARLCFDPHVRVRVAAANRLKPVLGVVRLSDWCSVNIGIASSRVTTLVSKIVEDLSPCGWLAALAEFLRRLYPANTSDYLAMLARLSNREVALNVVTGQDMLLEVGGPLEVSMRFLGPERVACIFKKKWKKREIQSWWKKHEEQSVAVPLIRDKLKSRLKSEPVSDISALLKAMGNLLDEAHNDLRILSELPIFSHDRAAFLKNMNLGSDLRSYRVSMPSNAGDLMAIGNSMKNCLRDRYWVMKYAMGSDAVISLHPKRSKPPRYLVVVDKTGKIIEMKGRFNTKVPDTIQNALQDSIRVAIENSVHQKTVKDGSLRGIDG